MGAHAFPSAPNASLELCHTCRTNHALHMGLLAAYYPAACSAAEEQALDAALPAYKAGLEARYPLLCDACRPSVEQTIHRRDRMSRASAMEGWLQRSRAAVAPVQVVRPMSAAIWALRGALWAVSFVAGLVLAADGECCRCKREDIGLEVCSAQARGVRGCLEPTALVAPAHAVSLTAAAEPSLLSQRASRSAAQAVLLSLPLALLWNFWNPLWLHAASARVRVGGDRVRLDGTAWWLVSLARASSDVPSAHQAALSSAHSLRS
ncbi:hypothetical protein FA09DRAFT_332449 [Tilletiopsis washingtonensis]|uniref:Ima1 N-terminal domain-containing protein n=1 Tax=Tilletiopsis washingtonensis TaxID=58919 RepID=A0A316Z0L5_9BASI|nr:hypothetical protein FA09DRAFT_332449 [Tilletiopsis washingtonensis]PWN95031.1 hypothetical protein FA09DRAFT_332449 [Tilletiopsis washingtonensis]